MLTYSIRNNTMKGGRIKINDASEWRVDPNAGTIDFVVPRQLGLKTGDSVITIDVINGNERVNSIMTTDAKRMGYIIYDHQYNVSEGYITYIDGLRYYIHDGQITIDGTDYQIEDKKVIVPHKLWIEDGNVTIEGDIVEVDTDLVMNQQGVYEKPQDIQYDGNFYEWYDYEPSKWHNITHVSMWISDQTTIGVEGVTCATLIPYIYYQGNRQAVSVNIDEEGKYTYSISGGTVVCEIEDTPWKDGEDIVYVDSPKLKIGETVCDIDHEITSTQRGEFLLIYLSDQYSVEDGNVIEISEDGASETRVNVMKKNGEKYIIFSGSKYTEGEGTVDFIEYNGTEYSITYIDDDGRTFSIDVNGEVIRFEFEDGPYGNKARKIISTDATLLTEFYGGETYDVERYGYFTVNARKYRIINDSETEYAIICEPNRWRYIVNAVINSNMAKCDLLCEGLTADEEMDVNEEVSELIGLNWKKYLFMKDVDKFRYWLYATPGGSDGEDDAYSDRKIWEDYEYYYIVNYITMNIPLNVDANIDINQADLIDNYLIGEIIGENINPIVDYEKDIYYPVRIMERDDEGTPVKFENVGEIEFNLHMRTRDVDTGEIIEEKTWNMFDKYKVEVPMDSSDLLGFFGFTTSDIYYQKSNIAKSFIRITVYDDTDPAKQNLLYMGCAFMDEHSIYLKYMNNIDNYSRLGVKNVKYDEIGENATYSKSANADSEPCNTSKRPTWNDESRLNSRITIKNRAENDTSSEGFYLYIFRELGSFTYERNLYMRIDFCNAETGVASPLCLLPSNGIGDEYIGYGMDELEKFKEGYPLRELYEHMYITLESIYDYNKKQYIYTFPKWTYKGNKVQLNLFEIKIKDES